MDESLKINESDSVEDKTEEDFTTSNSTREALKELPEVLTFIQRLQDCIFRQRSLIYKLHNKIKEASINDPRHKRTCEASTQTDEDDIRDLPIEPASLVQDIKEAAENAVQQTGFVYEATSGMYYDYNTGYYYNAELGLYYDGHNGIYYYFNESSKTFHFHSQVSVQSAPNISEPTIAVISEEEIKKRKNNVEKDMKQIPKKIKRELMEEGECSESSDESENEVDIVIEHISACDTIEIEDCTVNPTIAQNILLDDEMANAWPPCLRIVVKETGLENLPVGSLFIITCTGGTLGREGDHSVVIPDINISKHHARVSFNEEEKCYKIVDLGSRNGTLVDGQRLSVALRESEPVSLQHGTLVRVGSTVLECHLHPGRSTCDDCEPGCALHKESGILETAGREHETKEARHRSELRRLRKRFGLDKLSVKEATGCLPPKYQDRAEERRKTVGSQDHNAKTETASVDQHIQSNNKGFRMLSKMGWAKGQSLGKDSTKGITEPVVVERRPEKTGLGSDAVHLPPVDPKTKKKTEVWKKAQKRFQELDD